MKREISRLQQSRRRTQYEFASLNLQKEKELERLEIKRRDTKKEPLLHLKQWELSERDKRSLSISELEQRSIRLVNHLRSNERSTDGFERIKRIWSSGDTPLCVDAFLTIWENQDFFPVEWTEKHTGNQLKHIFFDGAVLSSSLFPEPFTPYLVATSEGVNYGFYPLSLPRHAQDLSAVV